MANIKISELTKNSSPSTSATLVGVDGGETVQIPIQEFVTRSDDNTINIHQILLLNERGDICGDIKVNDNDEIVISSTTGRGSGIVLQGLTTIEAPEAEGDTTLFGAGQGGQVLMTDGQNVYWGGVPSYSYVDNELSKALGTILATLNKI